MEAENLNAEDKERMQLCQLTKQDCKFVFQATETESLEGGTKERINEGCLYCESCGGTKSLSFEFGN